MVPIDPASTPAAPAISATEPDWSRETPRRYWDPARRLLRTLRRHETASRQSGPLAGLARRWWSLQHRFWSVITQTEIAPGTRIGGGLRLPHPNGIVIHPQCTIGPNCLIFQTVTLGKRTGHPGAPKVGGHVDIGAGARILGPVVIGDHAVIGANAVVIHDVPAHGVAVGVPARLLTPADAGAPPQT